MSTHIRMIRGLVYVDYVQISVQSTYILYKCTTVHYSCTRAVQYLNERNGNAVLCNYIDFDVIFQKNCTVQIL